jgi:hypothetical protein
MLEAAETTKTPEQLALLTEELQSPCYEEVAARPIARFRAGQRQRGEATRAHYSRHSPAP